MQWGKLSAFLQAEKLRVDLGAAGSFVTPLGRNCLPVHGANGEQAHAQGAAVLLLSEQACRMPQDGEVLQRQARNQEHLASVYLWAAVQAFCFESFHFLIIET